MNHRDAEKIHNAERAEDAENTEIGKEGRNTIIIFSCISPLCSLRSLCPLRYVFSLRLCGSPRFLSHCGGVGDGEGFDGWSDAEAVEEVVEFGVGDFVN